VGGEHGATLSCCQGRGDDAAHRIRRLWQSNHVALFTLHRINGTITPPSIDDQRAFRSLQQIGYIPAVHPTILPPPCAHVLWVPQNLPRVTYMCARGGDSMYYRTSYRGRLPDLIFDAQQHASSFLFHCYYQLVTKQHDCTLQTLLFVFRVR
jgi:hypothetical protein